MKSFFLIAATGLLTMSALAQPKLRTDNIDEVLKAMTLEEKATLLVGGARAVVVDGVPTGTAAKVPGAAGNTRPIERLGIPATELHRPSIAPVSLWVRCLPAPGTSTSWRP